MPWNKVTSFNTAIAGEVTITGRLACSLAGRLLLLLLARTSVILVDGSRRSRWSDWSGRGRWDRGRLLAATSAKAREKCALIVSSSSERGSFKVLLLRCLDHPAVTEALFAVRLRRLSSLALRGCSSGRATIWSRGWWRSFVVFILGAIVFTVRDSASVARFEVLFLERVGDRCLARRIRMLGRSAVAVRMIGRHDCG